MFVQPYVDSISVNLLLLLCWISIPELKLRDIIVLISLNEDFVIEESLLTFVDISSLCLIMIRK